MDGGNAVDILLIEDNPGDVRLITELLEEATDRSFPTAEETAIRTIDVHHANRLADALEILDSTAIDVVLLDLGLPDSTGIETLEAVRDRAPSVPTVVLTGLDDELVGIRAVQQGAQEYLTKVELTPTLLRRSLQHAIERKKFDRTQTALHRVSRELIQTESSGAVSEITVETAANVLDLEEIAILLFDDSSNVLEPVAYTDALAARYDTVPTFGPASSSITWQSFITDETIALEDVRDTDDSETDASKDDAGDDTNDADDGTNDAGDDTNDASDGKSARNRGDVNPHEAWFESGIWIPLGDHGVITILSDAAGVIDQQTRQLADHLAATAEAALDRVERESSLRENERTLAVQNRRLEELNRTNELIREIDQVLVQETTLEAIERAVCERLVRDDRFGFAWIASVGDDALEPRTWAGTSRGYLDSVSMSTNDSDPPPSVRAATSGAATVTPNVASDLQAAPWRKAALASNFSSVVSVPLTYNELSYGVLTVFAHEPDVFDNRSKELFAELGETIANAMNAVETKQALLTDTIVELELTIAGSAHVLGRLARDANCTIEYGGIVPQPDGTARLFFETSGASVGTITAVADAAPSIQRIDHIGETGDGEDDHRFEATVSGPTIPSTIVECGAIPRSISVAADEVDVVVELPATTDVRTFVDRLEETYPETDLIARRDKERSDRSPVAFESVLTGELTDRQLEALQTAYHSGYFSWPRERTGEEVAESLGITQPTFNAHLREAERKLCAMLFEGHRATTDPPITRE